MGLDVPIMFRSISIILSLLTWCCLAVPWLVCNSDCRDGSVQLLLHDCHAVDHHSCSPIELVEECRAGVEQDGDVCVEHEGETHISLVLSQASPGPVETFCPETSSIGLLEYPMAREVGKRARRSERVRSSVDPPGFETQDTVQLRTDVLLR